MDSSDTEIGGDADVNVISITDNLEGAPFPYMREFFKNISKVSNSNVFNFECLLCLKKNGKTIRCDSSSIGNLHKHISVSKFYDVTDKTI